MFLIVNDATGKHDFYFNDPREKGYEGPVVEGVTLESSDWLLVREGEPFGYIDEARLGRSKDNPKRYRPFKSEQECVKAGYDPVTSQFSPPRAWEAR